MSFDNLKKICIIKDSKKPACKWTDKNNHFLKIDTELYNVGILTGEINNLIVLDIDIKDNGLNEFNKYFNINDFKTPITKTPSGGYHIYFQYKNSNKILQYQIDNYLKNKSGYRNVGLDIRSKGGYVLSAPSSIGENNYTWLNSFSKYKPIEITEELLNWLLIDTTEKKDNIKKNSKQEITIYNISDEEIIN